MPSTQEGCQCTTEPLRPVSDCPGATGRPDPRHPGFPDSAVRGQRARGLAAGGGTRVSAESGQFSRWGRGARLTRRVREEPPPGELTRVYFDRNATMSGAKRRGEQPVVDRRPNAAWVSLPAVWPGWIAGRAPTGRNWAAWVASQAVWRDGSPLEPHRGTGPRGFHHRPLGGRRRGRSRTCESSTSRSARSPPGAPGQRSAFQAVPVLFSAREVRFRGPADGNAGVNTTVRVRGTVLGYRSAGSQFPFSLCSSRCGVFPAASCSYSLLVCLLL